MKLIIDALRWHKPITSEELEPINEVRFEQEPNSAYVRMFINGKDKPSMNVELNMEGGGEFIELLGDQEDPRLNHAGPDGTYPKTPRFTGNFDRSDFEAFYLTVTSAAGIDESVTPERAAELIVHYMVEGRS